VLKDLLLGHHPIMMRQEIGEHLKDFAPQLDRRSRTMQLMAFGVQDIVAKEVPHRLPLLVGVFRGRLFGET
jgi:hypothetical protein